MNPAMYLWVQVGCLECHEPTVFKGRFGSEADARTAIAAEMEEGWNGEVVVLREGEVIGGDNPYDGPWHGSALDAILVVDP